VTETGLVTPCSTGRALGRTNDPELLALLTNEAAVLPRWAAAAPDGFVSRANDSWRDVHLVIGMAMRYDLANREGQFRFGLALTTIIRLVQLIKAGANYRIVIADSSPDPMIKRILGQIDPDNVVVLDAGDFQGIGPQNQLAVAYAYMRGALRFLKIDPEKYGLADSEILASICMAVGSHDILGVGRLPGVPGQGFSTLPTYQQGSETRMSRDFVNLGLPEDGASGIWCLNRTGMIAWLAFDTEKYGNMWQILWHTQLLALAAGLQVGGILLPFVHPKEMVEFEEGRLDWDPAAADSRASFYRDKRDAQADLVKVVAKFAAEVLGITPRPPVTGYLI
jgi:hypothetical protein